ncbi:2-octaprenyl-6-methoxyphenol hydroxylase [Marinobacter segnicrescens]|uniref:2-octaprenyl-6-methoxyphenol hydroxylase n=1 Tax=Marinobacter segnicrescens TaxID=430453 RepID=A0A1H9ZWL5_9GAMM|nr:2-octaprenyl-6-methoxyphenyl hydroxylase [Marinobacter segnicrescens]SES85275.1 2-octaprenyl-6-methoxyphenol hydroxylase [Marinobacter segnicrescens]
MQTFETDILIAGGGLAGATLALAIARLIPDYRVTVVEAFPLSEQPAPTDYQPSYDARSTALSWGSRQIFEHLGLWSAIEQQAAAIRHIHVSERGRLGVTRLAAEDHHQPALGYVADNRWLGLCLMDALRAESAIRWLAPARATSVTTREGGVQVTVREGSEGDEGQEEVLNARCLVVADGGRSGLREALGIEVTREDYDQYALIANVSTELPHQGTAWERFTDRGPMALLPQVGGPEPGHRSALVWTLSPVELEEILALDDATRCQRLQAAFGWRLGRFTRFGEPHHYPLSLTLARETIRPGVALVGNAAHSLHPVAGQGFNLALRGLMALVEAFRLASQAGRSPGDLQVLARYQQAHQADQRQTVGFSDTLVRLFGGQYPAPGIARSAGLAGLDIVPGAKRWFARQAMGLGTGGLAADRREEHWQ